MYTFREYLADKEQAILSQLPHMDMVQQAKKDMELHTMTQGDFGYQGKQLVDDKVWKQHFIDIVQGKQRNPEVVSQTINKIEQDLASHERPADKKTGSDAWNQGWIAVYKQWLVKLHQILGELNGT